MSITPTPISINDLFGSIKYYIDFYQREYKWKKDHVISLLDDIFYRYDNDYNSNLDATKENISKYSWYYLNTLITNYYDGKLFIVDGQQRLTTLTLMLIKLHKLANKFSQLNLKEVLERKIYGADISGFTFWMGRDGRGDILEKLLTDSIGDSEIEHISHKNIVVNYDIVGKYLDAKLDTSHKYECFVIYFLERVMLVKIDIGATEDVPMVFEVINDRGERLRPYEVLKGQLLGRLSKGEIHRIYHPLWRDSLEPLEGKGEEEADNFFKYFFRSKYANTEYEHRQFDGDYHRTILSRDWDSEIGLRENIGGIKEFITDDMKYYTNLYNKLIDDDVYAKPYGEFVYYNKLNEQDRQYLLIMSACTTNDRDEEQKIVEIARLFDRHFSLLQLYGCYDSVRFTEILVDINSKIRNTPLDQIKIIFDDHLLNDINTIRNVNATSLFEYTFFKEANRNLGIRFIRYFFARVENFIATQISPSYQLTESQMWDLVRNTGHKTGYHIEHILANNEENLGLFDNDEEYFQRERNRFGGLLLLKGRDNISSGNERYQDKLSTYNNADISNRWNRSLISSFYHTNREFHEFFQSKNLPFKPYEIFDGGAVENRQKLLFEMVKLIWG